MMKDEMGEVCRTHWRKRDAYRALLGQPEAKRPLDRPRCKKVE